jgi:hypothetical protein
MRGDEDGQSSLSFWLVLIVLSFAGAASASVPPPKNQCPEDCSPCLGETDPFCEPTGPPIASTPDNCFVCGLNRSRQLDCLGVVEGQTGSDKCGLVTMGPTVVQCKAEGSSCAYINVTP